MAESKLYDKPLTAQGKENMVSEALRREATRIAELNAMKEAFDGLAYARQPVTGPVDNYGLTPEMLGLIKQQDTLNRNAQEAAWGDVLMNQQVANEVDRGAGMPVSQTGMNYDKQLQNEILSRQLMESMLQMAKGGAR